MNLQRLGYYQCPCRLSWDDRTKDQDIICPCVYAHDDIAEFGHCFCSLYLSEEFDRSGEEPAASRSAGPWRNSPTRSLSLSYVESEAIGLALRFDRYEWETSPGLSRKRTIRWENLSIGYVKLSLR